MAVSYFVFYRGQARNPGEFVRRYREVHVPILSAWPGIGEIALHTPADWSDAERVNPAGFGLVCQMSFADQQSLGEALNSEARRQARADFKKFPAFDGEVWHQAFLTERLR